ncbi:MAG TPA: toll/interleukin-1 receptor domain-containing protein [Pyrinomonadaceae bacterium]|nr:toll/interleukin-1 receptor domain-containing protein [Pyrinomonadaceae bacterium]
MEYDVFISYASEDKEEIALPLASRLKKLGLKVWLDKFEINIGDSVRRSIDRGLSNSRFGIVVLSPHFFRKEWTKKELDALLAKSSSGSKVILPVWHNISRDEVARFSLLLADIHAADTRRGVESVAEEIYKSLQSVIADDPVGRSRPEATGDHSSLNDEVTVPAADRTLRLGRHLALQLPKYVDGVAQLTTSPKKFISGLRGYGEIELANALLFLFISTFITQVLRAPYVSGKEGVLWTLVADGIFKLIYLMIASALLHSSFRFVGGLAPYRRILIASCYFFSWLMIFIHLTLLSVYSLIFLYPIWGHAWVDRLALSLMLISLLGVGFWSFKAWGAYQALAGVSHKRAFAAFLVFCFLNLIVGSLAVLMREHFVPIIRNGIDHWKAFQI